MNRVRTLVQDLRQHLDADNIEQAAETLDELENWVGSETVTTVSECEECGSDRLDFRPPEYMTEDMHIQRIPCRECGHVQIETWALKSVKEGDA